MKSWTLKARPRPARGHPRSTGGFTLTELLVASGLGLLLLSVAASVSLFSARSFVALGNYTDLDAKSRNALDTIGRETRQATAVLAFETNLPIKSLTLTNADQGQRIKLTWDSVARTLVFEQTGAPAQTRLTECDRWDFALYQRTPLVTPTNIFFYPATNSAGLLDPRACKLINMSWKCSRLILGQKGEHGNSANGANCPSQQTLR